MFRRIFLRAGIPAVLLTTFWASPAWGQLSPRAAWAATAFKNYRVQPDITYLTASNWRAELDLYQPTGLSEPAPTLVYFHGGGWYTGDKDEPILRLLPYLEMGWAVVNVEYRRSGVSLAPAAVEDCRCALRWVVDNAGRYNLDPDRIVVSGHSAGGHLALTTGMLTSAAGLDYRCLGGKEEPKVAAIVNWYGITDVLDLIQGNNIQRYALRWLGVRPDRESLARRVSPLTYVRPDLPPILTVHGENDPLVPYPQAVRLHRALTEAGVPNRLVTIPEGPHGPFSPEETLRAHTIITEFLEQHGLTRVDRAEPAR